MDIGTRLREARLRRGLALGEVARITKIPIGTLQAIECNDIDRIPRGIFARGFVRAFAGVVDLNPDELVKEYLTQFEPDQVGPPQPPEGAPSPSSSRLQLVAVLAVGIALSAYGYHTFFRAKSVPLAPPPAAPPAHTVGTMGESPAPKAQSPAAPRGTITVRLDIHPSAACWVAATADRQTVVSRLVQAGEHVSVEAHDEVVLRVSDADACTYSVNGTPARSLGQPGKTALVRITSNNYKSFQATSAGPTPVKDAPRPVPVISPPQKMIDRSEARAAAPERPAPARAVSAAPPVVSPAAGPAAIEPAVPTQEITPPDPDPQIP